MKKIILSLSLGLFGTLTFAQGLDSIIVEKYYIANAADTVGGSGASGTGTLPVGSVTYRVYVDMATGYKLQSVYGDAVHNLIYNTTTSFFNATDRGATTPNGIGTAFLNDNTNALDSWISMGAAASGQLGVLKTEDVGGTSFITGNAILNNAPASIGTPIKTQDGMMAGTLSTITLAGIGTELDILDNVSQAGNSIVFNNHAIAVAGGVSGPTANNRVLIGQFTTDGVFHFELNIQIGSGAAVEQYVSSAPTGAEMTHASLTYTSAAAIANVAPTVSISAPATAATYTTGATVTMVATAADTDGSIDSVEFFVDGIKIGKDISSPYSYTLTSTVGTHTLTAVATDNNGAQTTSATKTIIVSDPVIGLNELSASASLLVYPNPATDLITIEINNLTSGVATYSIYDVIGNVILNKNLGNIDVNYQEKLDVSSFKSGQYILELLMNGVVSTKKIIVN